MNLRSVGKGMQLKAFHAGLALLALVSCKDTSEKIELLDLAFSESIFEIVDPKVDLLSFDEFGWLVNIKSANVERFTVAGISIDSPTPPDSFTANVQFQLYSKPLRDEGVAKWDAEYQVNATGTAWERLEDIPGSARPYTFNSKDLPTYEVLKNLIEQRQATHNPIGYSITLRDRAQFDRVTQAILDKLGEPAPQESYGNQNWPGTHWVLEDRVVVIAPKHEQITVRALTQAHGACLMVPTAGLIDLGGCDQESLFKSDPYYFTFPKEPE